MIYETIYDLQRIPNCSVKNSQPLKEFVGRCQTMPSRVKKSFCGCLQVSLSMIHVQTNTTIDKMKRKDIILGWQESNCVFLKDIYQ